MEIDKSRRLAAASARIVAAYVGNNAVPREDVVSLVRNVHAALSQAASASVDSALEEKRLAELIRNSIAPHHLVCLEDGKKFRTLKRHLRDAHGMTPAEYRSKWGLKRDYPITAPSLSRRRSAVARNMGLGQKPS